MKNREPIEFKGFMMIYNIGATLLNIYVFVEVRTWIYLFSSGCLPSFVLVLARAVVAK